MIMDLDEIKKTWQENVALKEKLSISDNRIKEMVKMEGKTTIGKLMLYSKLYIIFSIPMGLFFCMCSYLFFQAGWPYTIVPLFFLAVCALIVFPSEIYLYRLLKSIDFSTMTLKDVSAKILKYQQIIRRWEMGGILGFIVFLGIWMPLYYKLAFGNEIRWGFIIYMIVIFVLGLLAIPYLYKKLYYKNISKVKESVKELEEFEQDEIN